MPSAALPDKRQAVKRLAFFRKGVHTVGEIENYSSKPVHILHRHFAVYMPMLSLDFCVGITVCIGFLSLKILWSLIRKGQWKFYWSCSYLLKMKTVWLLKTCVYTSFKMCMYVSIIWKWLVFQNDKRYLTLECVPDDRRKILMMHIEELDRKGPPPPPTASEPSRRNAK